MLSCVELINKNRPEKCLKFWRGNYTTQILIYISSDATLKQFQIPDVMCDWDISYISHRFHLITKKNYN